MKLNASRRTLPSFTRDDYCFRARCLRLPSTLGLCFLNWQFSRPIIDRFAIFLLPWCSAPGRTLLQLSNYTDLAYPKKGLEAVMADGGAGHDNSSSARVGCVPRRLVRRRSSRRRPYSPAHLGVVHRHRSASGCGSSPGCNTGCGPRLVGATAQDDAFV